MGVEKKLIWERGKTSFVWNGCECLAPAPILCAVELPQDTGVAITTLFDETTPKNKTNAFVYLVDKHFESIEIRRDDHLTRFLGCYVETEFLVLGGADDFEYILSLDDFSVVDTRYYR